MTGILQIKLEEATSHPSLRIELIKSVINIQNWKTCKTYENEEFCPGIFYLEPPEGETERDREGGGRERGKKKKEKGRRKKKEKRRNERETEF